jgi:hypothetical protein
MLLKLARGERNCIKATLLLLMHTVTKIKFAVAIHASDWRISDHGGHRGVSATFSCLQVTATSVVVQLTFSGFIFTSFPSVGADMIGWEG